MAHRLLRRKILAAVLAVVVLLTVCVLLVPDARDFLSSLPAIRQAYCRYYNLRYPSRGPAEMGDGGPALDIRLQDPIGIAEDRFGNVYVSDRGNASGGRFIWQLNRRGGAHVIAGTGRKGIAPAGMAARASDLGSPEGLAVDNLNRVYFADSFGNVVLRIDQDGQLVRVAGTGRRGYGGDGGPATEAALNKPYDVRCDSLGNLYIADFGNHRIRKVTRDGVIRTIAGTGEPGYSGDGGPAVAARLHGPYGIFVVAADRVFIADSFNHVIRHVDEKGVITTIAGVGRPGYAGDGGPARAALLDTPQSIVALRSGRMYVGDEHNHAIRIVEPDGIISTLIGNGAPGFAGEGSPAAEAQLNDPENMLVRSDGSMLLTDGDNRRVLHLDTDGLVHAFAGRGRRVDHRPQRSSYFIKTIRFCCMKEPALRR